MLYKRLDRRWTNYQSHLRNPEGFPFRVIENEAVGFVSFEF